MASKRTGRKFLTDNVVNARRGAPKPARVTIISGGVKYKNGVAVGRVCPTSSVRGAVRGMIARALPAALPVKPAATVEAPPAEPTADSK
jgi:hypothetical protein